MTIWRPNKINDWGRNYQFVKSVMCNFEKDISYSQRNIDYFLVIRKKMQLCNGMIITLIQGHSYYH